MGAVADITDPAAVERALSELSRIDVLINNAGLERLTPIAEGGSEIEAMFRRIIEINIVGTAIVTRRALAKMEAGAAIINTASIWGRVAEPLFGRIAVARHLAAVVIPLESLVPTGEGFQVFTTR